MLRVLEGAVGVLSRGFGGFNAAACRPYSAATECVCVCVAVLRTSLPNVPRLPACCTLAAALAPQIQQTGLDGPHGGPVLPHSKRQPLPGKAPIVMFETIQQHHSQHPEQGRVQLICTGALSNAALLLLLYPEVKDLIDITIMGGAMGVSQSQVKVVSYFSLLVFKAAGGLSGLGKPSCVVCVVVLAVVVVGLFPSDS